MSLKIFHGHEPAAAITGNDRGLSYGDGVFETMLVHEGQAVWWSAHYQRLRRGAQTLGIPVPDESFIQQAMTDLIERKSSAVLKLLLTRGPGKRGYALPDKITPTLVLSCHDTPPAQRQPVCLQWCQTTLAIQPALAGIKHLNRLEQVLARAEWTDPNIFDGLMCDGDGRVVGATAANLFIRHDGRWLTPPVYRCGIAGIARAWLLAQLDDVVEADLSVADVNGAEALFLCNALRGIVPVHRLAERKWSDHDGVARIRQQLADAEPAFAAMVKS